MGLLKAIAGGLSNIASKGRDTTMLAQVFQEHQGFARLSFQILQRSAAERNIEVNEQLINDARIEVSKYPKILIGEFLDGYANRRMNKRTGKF